MAADRPVADALAVQAEGALVLDVREAAEVAQGSVPGAVHIPLGDLPSRLGELPRDRVIACLCRSGNRSGTAANYLNEQGFDALNLVGGMLAWTGETLPIT
jgi:rhodanese-related sulfurtransferase